MPDIFHEPQNLSDCSDHSHGNRQSLKDHATNFINILLDSYNVGIWLVSQLGDYTKLHKVWLNKCMYCNCPVKGC